VTEIVEELGYDVTATSNDLKLHCALTNINQFCPNIAQRPLSWTGVRSTEGLTTIKLAVSVERRTRNISCPFCSAPRHQPVGIFLSLPEQLLTSAKRMAQFCDEYVDGFGPL
jgi:hypothetical protein